MDSDWNDQQETAPEPQPEQRELVPGLDYPDPEKAPEVWPLVEQPAGPQEENGAGLRFGDMERMNVYGNGGYERNVVVEANRGIEPGDDTYWIVARGKAKQVAAPFSDVLGAEQLPDDLYPYVLERAWVSGAKGVIAGGEKSVKSTTVSELLVSLTTGTPMFGIADYSFREQYANRCILIQTERDDDLVKDDIDRIAGERGVDPAVVYERAQVLKRAQSLKVNLLDDASQQWLRRKAQEGYRYCFIDPIYMSIGEADISDRSGNVPGVLRFLDELHELGMATIITMPAYGLGTRHLFGSKYFRLWLECAIFTGWDDRHNLATFKFHGIRYRKSEATHKLRGLGIGSWQPYSKEAEQQPSTNPVTQQPNTTNESRALEKAERIKVLLGIRDSNPDAGSEELLVLMERAGKKVAQRTLERYLSEIAAPGDDE